MINHAIKNETAKTTDYIWLVMHMDVQGWKERRGRGEEDGSIMLEGTEKRLKRERSMAGSKKSMQKTAVHHNINKHVTLCQPLHYDNSRRGRWVNVCYIPPYCVLCDHNLPIKK